MNHLDRTGITAACLALALASGAWLAELGADRGGAGAGLDPASVQALESHSVGQPMIWQDRRTGSRATIIPASAYRDGSGRWCRPYSVAITGQRSAQSHVACRDGSGKWRRLQGPMEQVAGQ